MSKRVEEIFRDRKREWFFAKREMGQPPPTRKSGRFGLHPGGHTSYAKIAMDIVVCLSYVTCANGKCVCHVRIRNVSSKRRKLAMSKKSRKSQSVAASAPVLVSDVAEQPVTEIVETPAAEIAAEVPTAPVAEVAAAPTPVKTKKYPREGGKCWQVWNACDTLLASGTHPTVAHLRAHAIEHNWNVSNASQEFYAWRKYHGRK
jgi:hypothetical protein